LIISITMATRTTAKAYAVLKDCNSLNKALDHRVAGNSLAANPGLVLTETSGFAEEAGAASKCIGVCTQTKTFDSDNETVAKDLVTYEPVFAGKSRKMPIEGGSVTQADVGNYFGLTAAQAVEGTDSTATKTSSLNWRLVEFVSATKGLFEIDNDIVD